MKDEYKAVGSWGTLGLEIVLSIMVGFFGGRWLDGRFGTGPWISVVGFFFGCGAAGKAIHRTWQEMQAVTAREERERGNPAPLYERPRDRKGAQGEGGEGEERKGSNGAEGSPTSPEEHDERPS
jgi:ATP synthase protein I